ncbi:MAG TPA: hypothetical protein VL263_22835 [Vicinamibacterales bacterium]|nr:hypothetical protein [Vicinamibacterales bacterium]
MIKTFPVMTMSAVVVTAALRFPVAAPAQSTSQPDVYVPRMDLAATARFTRIPDGAADRRWIGPGFALTIDRGVTPYLAAAVQVETDLHHLTGFLSGAQVSTPFYYGSARDPVPGRFFGRALTGAVTDELGAGHPAAQLSGGADVLLSRARAIGLRWEVGYQLMAGAGAAPGHADGRAAIGLLFGPRLNP